MPKFPVYSRHAASRRRKPQPIVLRGFGTPQPGVPAGRGTAPSISPSGSPDLEWGIKLTNAKTGKSEWYDTGSFLDFDEIQDDLGLDIDDPNLILSDWDSDSFQYWKPSTYDIEETLRELDLINDLVESLGEDIFEFHYTYDTAWDEIEREWGDKYTGYDEDDFVDYVKEIYEDDCSGHAADYVDWDQMARDELNGGDYSIIGDKVFRDDY